MTVNLIIQSQKGDSRATLMLIKKYDPLLKKYAYKLYYDDAYYDLLSDFIEFLHYVQLDRLYSTSEGTLVSYICTVVRSSYIKRLRVLKKHQNSVSYSDLSENELYYAEAALVTLDTHFELELTGIDHLLTESELSVVEKIYLLGYTVAETAAINEISRQAVNKTKNGL